MLTFVVVENNKLLCNSPITINTIDQYRDWQT